MTENGYRQIINGGIKKKMAVICQNSGWKRMEIGIILIKKVIF